MSNKNNENLEPQKGGAGEEYVTSTDSAKLLSDVLADEKKRLKTPPPPSRKPPIKPKRKIPKRKAARALRAKRRASTR